MALKSSLTILGNERRIQLVLIVTLYVMMHNVRLLSLTCVVSHRHHL